MKTATGTRENVKVIEEFTSGGLKVEVLEYEKLLGLSNASMAQQIYFMEQQHIHVRQIALYLNNEKVTIERGAMSYFQGNIEMVSGVTLGNALGKLVRGAVTGEQMAQPEYSGTGLLVLEPSFKHFLVLELAANESIIVDDGMFYCAQGSVSVKVISQRNLSSAVAGGESFFQQQLTGPGIVILESTVPMSEVDIIDLENDTLKVDGNFAVLRSSTLDFTVERSAKTLMGSAVSGEGLVNVYRGTGQVWLAPTIKAHVTEFYKNNRLQREKIKSHPVYRYGVLREEMQDYILDKLGLLIAQKTIRGTGENGTEYTIISTVLNMNKDIIRMIQKFDFTKKNPKLIYINTTETVISLEDSILTAFLSLLGFDVVFFVPTGYQSVEKYFNTKVMEEHQIGEYLYDLQVPNFELIPSGTRQSWRDRLFKRGG